MSAPQAAPPVVTATPSAMVASGSTAVSLICTVPAAATVNACVVEPNCSIVAVNASVVVTGVGAMVGVSLLDSHAPQTGSATVINNTARRRLTRCVIWKLPLWLKSAPAEPWLKREPHKDIGRAPHEQNVVGRHCCVCYLVLGVCARGTVTSLPSASAQNTPSPRVGSSRT